MSDKLQLLTWLYTESCTVRSEVHGWGDVENPHFYVSNKPIGWTPSESNRRVLHAKTVLEALSYGWKLLGPAVKLEDGTYEWWLHKIES